MRRGSSATSGTSMFYGLLFLSGFFSFSIFWSIGGGCGGK